MNHPARRPNSFSLVEVVLALGIAAFSLLTVTVLLPLGIKNNCTSSEETNAANVLTSLEGDLRNTHPKLNSGKSRFFSLVLPYKIDATTQRVVVNDAVQINTLSTDYSVGLSDDGQVVAYTSSAPRPRYQVSVIYTQIPAAGSSAPIQARLIVNWPAKTTLKALTSAGNLNEFVEAYVAFPAP